jgi:hypothetical protein
LYRVGNEYVGESKEWILNAALKNVLPKQFEMTVLQEKQGKREVQRDDWLSPQQTIDPVRQLMIVILRPGAPGSKGFSSWGDCGCVELTCASRIDETIALEDVEDCSAR